MTRYQYIEKILRQVYGQQPADDSDITFDLVNQWLSEALAIAAKNNYTDGIKLDGVAYVNNGFYTTFKGLSISKDENFLYKIELPSIPVGIGTGNGISTLVLKDNTGKITYPCVPLSMNQNSYYRSMRPVQNKVLFYQEGKNCFLLTSLLLSIGYTASVSMISGGDMNNLDSELNIPPDYLPIIDEYLYKQLTIERNTPKDNNNDGTDN